MTIIVKSISEMKGRVSGGKHFDDFKDIIANQTYGGANNIKKIDIKAITDISISIFFIDSIRFVYNVVTKNGTSYEHQGNKLGTGPGTDQPPFDIATHGELIEIRGRIGKSTDGYVRTLRFITSQTTLNCGTDSPDYEEFVFPPNVVIFGNSENYINSIGVYEIIGIENVTESNSIAPSTTAVIPYAATETIFC
ncbi:3711_t:CDS:2 [Entrophospora sp. SA101]|nr:3711_t:CDS:2 [Entrophospora sp. SA101]